MTMTESREAVRPYEDAVASIAVAITGAALAVRALRKDDLA